MAAPVRRMKYFGLALLIAGVAALLLYGSRKDGALPLATIATEAEIQSRLPQLPETLNRPLYDRRGDELHAASWRVTTLSTIEDLLSLKRGIAPDFAHEITTLLAGDRNKPFFYLPAQHIAFLPSTALGQGHFVFGVLTIPAIANNVQGIAMNDTGDAIVPLKSDGNGVFTLALDDTAKAAILATGPQHRDLSFFIAYTTVGSARTPIRIADGYLPIALASKLGSLPTVGLTDDDTRH